MFIHAPMGADFISRAIRNERLSPSLSIILPTSAKWSLLLPHLPASNNHQQRACGYSTDFLEVAPELPTLCLALLAKLLGVFGLFAATLFAGVPDFLSHREISLASGF